MPLGRPDLGLQVTSFDKRLDLPRVYLDRHQLPSEFSAPAKETNPLCRSFGLRICGVSCGEKGIILPVSFMRLSVHCQSPELRQPAWAGKVGASGPPAHLRGGPSPVQFLLGTHQSGRARRDSDRGDAGLLRLSGGALAPKRLQSHHYVQAIISP